MNNRVFVGNLKYQVTNDQLREAFAEIGPVIQVDVVRDQDDRAKFAFVEMETEDAAALAIEKLEGRELLGRAIHCEQAKPKRDGDRNREGAGHARPGDRKWEG